MIANRRCAYLTMEDTTGFFTYDHLTVEPLAKLGWDVQEIPWKRVGVCWDEFDVVVIRSTWDYQDSPHEFMKVLERIDASSARLENPLEIVRWNVNKTYLRDLQDRGVAIVPTEWLCGLDENKVPQLHHDFDVEEIVVKPIIGANADDTFRLVAHGSSEALCAAVETFHTRDLMAQPFIPGIVDVGEYSLFYFAGNFSHAILKKPQTGDFRVQEEHGGTVSSTSAGADLLAAGQVAMDAIGRQLLYARVDLVRLPSGEPALMELELIEPSLYFPYDSQAPKRFAQALQQMFDL